MAIAKTVEAESGPAVLEAPGSSDVPPSLTARPAKFFGRHDWLFAAAIFLVSLALLVMLLTPRTAIHPLARGLLCLGAGFFLFGWFRVALGMIYAEALVWAVVWEELTELMFAWRAAAHVRSNAIVLCRGLQTVGIGAAQVSRQVAVEVALRRAGDRAKMAVMASDAYFPFPDAIAHAAIAGVTAIIQPGGSRRDEMAIEVADRHHLAMVFTGRRHFRH